LIGTWSVECGKWQEKKRNAERGVRKVAREKIENGTLDAKHRRSKYIAGSLRPHAVRFIEDGTDLPVSFFQKTLKENPDFSDMSD
jgi:hypothetical protein